MLKMSYYEESKKLSILGHLGKILPQITADFKKYSNVSEKTRQMTFAHIFFNVTLTIKKFKKQIICSVYFS